MQEESSKISIGVAHVRAARGLLKWTQEELAERSGVTATTINLWENERHHPTEKTRERIRDAFEKAGVMFLNGGQPGVRLVGVKTEQ